MRVVELWRFPVKSLQGERVESVEVTAEGLAGDRQFALFDLDSGFGLTARRRPVLLFASARTRSDGSVEITLPDGSVAEDDEALSNWLGHPVALRSTNEQVARRYENPADVEHESDWEPFAGSTGAFHDSQGAAVSLASLATVGDWATRRFRTNVLIDGADEDALVGGQVALGDAVLDVGMRIERCVMVTRPQPGRIDKDLGVLRTIHRERQGCLAVGGTVARTGTVSVGDKIRTLPGV
jgi:uncharacterized protein YcbX